ncbi:hypothetical protein GC177_08060 [bacterium]|nr:hypothetical protein [bacterium]
MLRFKRPNIASFMHFDRFSWVALAILVVVCAAVYGARLASQKPPETDPLLKGVDLAKEAALFDAGNSLGLCYTDGLVTRIRNAEEMGNAAEVQNLIGQGEAMCDQNKDMLGKAAFLASGAEAAIQGGNDLRTAEELYQRLLKLTGTALPEDDAAVHVIRGYRVVALRGIATIYTQAAAALKEHGNPDKAAQYEAAATQMQSQIDQLSQSTQENTVKKP